MREYLTHPAPLTRDLSGPDGVGADPSVPLRSLPLLTNPGSRPARRVPSGKPDKPRVKPTGSLRSTAAGLTPR